MNRRLSICIPSYNRGRLAFDLVSSIIKRLEERNDIEICLSNNGSTKGERWYKEISMIDDDRLQYYEFDHNKGVMANIVKTIELSSADLCVLLSDEDDIVMENIDYYVSFAETHQETALILGAVRGYASDNKSPQVFPKGIEAIRAAFFTRTYISGHVINKRFLTMSIIDEIKVKYGNTVFYSLYGFEYWYIVILSSWGGAIIYDKPIAECFNDAGLTYAGEEIGYKPADYVSTLVSFATPESRLEQAKDMISFSSEASDDSVIQLEIIKKAVNVSMASVSVLYDSKHSVSSEIIVERTEQLKCIYNDLRKQINSVIHNSLNRDANAYLDSIYDSEVKHNLASVYLDTLLYMPKPDIIVEWLKERGYKKIGIYGVGYISERLAIKLYDGIASVFDVVLIDRNRISIQNMTFRSYNWDFYKEKIVLPEDVGNIKCDIVIVTAIHVFDSVKKSLTGYVECPVISVVDLLKDSCD